MDQRKLMDNANTITDMAKTQNTVYEIVSDMSTRQDTLEERITSMEEKIQTVQVINCHQLYLIWKWFLNLFN